MKLLDQLKTAVTGTLTGSCIVLFNPITPPGTTQKTYTLEELSYQDTQQEEKGDLHRWSYQWVSDRGFILKPERKDNSAQQPVRLRRAVHRSIVE